MKFLEKYGIFLKDIDTLKTALTHSSYSNEHNVASYERLEFLGDAVLDLVVADYLYTNHKETEGEMTKVRANYVCENANYTYATDLDLQKYILVGHGESKDGEPVKKAIVADIFEALMGAIYIDQGYATVRNVILNIVVPYMENPDISFFSDYKSSLQEFVQTEQKSVEYIITNEEGPAHNKTFTVDAVIEGIVYGTGVGSSKKEAEQEAAKMAIEKLAVK
jgi:ribonuclease-3